MKPGPNPLCNSAMTSQSFSLYHQAQISFLRNSRCIWNEENNRYITQITIWYGPAHSEKKIFTISHCEEIDAHILSNRSPIESIVSPAVFKIFDFATSLSFRHFGLFDLFYFCITHPNHYCLGLNRVWRGHTPERNSCGGNLNARDLSFGAIRKWALFRSFSLES